jgi:hypothetical protein
MATAGKNSPAGLGRRSGVMNALFDVLSHLPAYRGKTLVEWFAEFLQKSDADLEREGSNFLKVLTTWVVRQYSGRRKGGVPIGNLDRFAYRNSEKIDFTRAVMVFIVRILRKRGLRETDLSRKSPTFELLVRAYEKTERS